MLIVVFLRFSQATQLYLMLEVNENSHKKTNEHSFGLFSTFWFLTRSFFVPSSVLCVFPVLHCGGANNSLEKRVMLNFSFRNPKVTGDIGYKGSIFPGYEKQMQLEDIGKALESYSKGEADPFAQYGNGV